MIGLIDVNNFYASCEQAFNPSLVNLPIVVLSNNDGCIISRNQEAKKLGIKMGAPTYKYEALFKTQNVQIFSSNYQLYQDMSNRVMNILAMFSSEIEIYSIDEAFFKIPITTQNLEMYGQKIKSTIYQYTGLPIGVGIGQTKALAKTANKIAKKKNSVCVIDNKEKMLQALHWLPITDVWGIGYRNVIKLKKMGVRTAYDYTQLPSHWVRQHLTVVGLRLKYDLLGEEVLPLELEPEPKKNIATTRSFDFNIKDYTILKERIVTFAVSCAEKLRKQQSMCHSLSVFISSNIHRNDLKQYINTIHLNLPYATNSNFDLAKYAVKALDKIYKLNIEYKKAGVIVSKITCQTEVQTTLFGNVSEKQKKLLKAIDSLNTTYGQQKIRLATQAPGRVWRMRQEYLSPKYTTDINDIIKVKAE